MAIKTCPKVSPMLCMSAFRYVFGGVRVPVADTAEPALSDRRWPLRMGIGKWGRRVDSDDE
jgi:hypothetical protein